MKMTMKKLLGYMVLSVVLALSDAKRNIRVQMPSYRYCGNSPKEIDGAVIESVYDARYASSACVIKFEADDDYTSKRIQVNLTDVQIKDCSKKLSVYFDDDSKGRADHEVTCNSMNPGVVKSNSKYVTLRLDGALSQPDRFKIVLTTYKPGSTIYCSEFRCTNRLCIDDDLRCDGYNHCADNSDEAPCTTIRTDIRGDNFDLTEDELRGVVKTGVGVIVGIVIAVIVICVLCCVTIICCCRRRQSFKGTVIRGPASQSTTTTAVPPPAATAVPLQPMPQPNAYPPPQQPGYPPAQPGMYPQPQPGVFQQPGGFQQPPPAYPVAPPAYHDKPYTDQGPYPAPPPIQQQLEKSGAPTPAVPSAPPPS